MMNEHDMNILWPYMPGPMPQGRVAAGMRGGQRRDRIRALLRQRPPAQPAALPGVRPAPPANPAQRQAGAPGSITLGRSRKFGPFNSRYVRIKVEVLGGLALLPPSGSRLSGQVTQEALSAEISHEISERVSAAATVEFDADSYQELGEALNDADPRRFGRVLAENLGLTAAFDLNAATIEVGTQYDDDLCFWSLQFTTEPVLIRVPAAGQDVHFSGQVAIYFGPTEEVYRRIAQRIGGQVLRAAIRRWASRLMTAQAAARLVAALEVAGILAATASLSAIATIGALMLLEQAHQRGRRWGALQDYALGYLRRVFSGQPGFPRYHADVGNKTLGWNDAQRALQGTGVRHTLIRNFAGDLNLSNDRNLPTLANRFFEFLDDHREDVLRYLRRRDSQRNAG